MPSTTSNYLLRVREGMSEITMNLLVNLQLTSRPKPSHDVSLAGQSVVVTGANRGIGRKVSEDMINRGAKLIMLCRDIESGEEVATELREKWPQSEIFVYQCDLSNFASIKNCVQKVKTDHQVIDVLINNAGMLTEKRSVTESNLEMMMAVNYFGTIALTLQLFDLVKKSKFARILFVSSLAHLETKHVHLDDLNWSKNGRKFKPFVVFGHTKLTLMLFLSKFAKVAFGRHNVRVYAIDPGMSKTDLGRDMSGVARWAIYNRWNRVVFRSVRESANSVILVALLSESDEYRPENFYYMDGRPQTMSKYLQSPQVEEHQNQLWTTTKETLGDIVDDLCLM